MTPGDPGALSSPAQVKTRACTDRWGWSAGPRSWQGLSDSGLLSGPTSSAPIPGPRRSDWETDAGEAGGRPVSPSDGCDPGPGSGPLSRGT